MYWHSDEAKIVYRRSAFNTRLLKADIKDVLALHLFEAHTYKGRPSKWDVVYGGGDKGRSIHHGRCGGFWRTLAGNRFP